MTKIFRIRLKDGRSRIFALWKQPIGVSVSKFNPVTETFEAYAYYDCLNLKQTKKQLEMEVNS